MDAKVIPFPSAASSCENCTLVLYGRGGLYCRALSEDIYDPKIAEECEYFDAED